MNKHVLIIIFSFIILSCDKNENQSPCDVLVNGVYQYPELPENHGWTREQINEFINLPEDICKCISTEGLIESCMDYPDLLSYMMLGNLQEKGYILARDNFRGLGELERRADAGKVLLAKYRTMDPQGYDASSTGLQDVKFCYIFYTYELILARNVMKLNKKEKISLVETCHEKIHLKNTDPKHVFINSFLAKEGSEKILFYLMLEDEYKEFLEIYNSNSIDYELIVEISYNYLTFLKSQ